MFDSALKYLTDQLGEPTRGDQPEPGWAGWALRAAGPMGGFVTVELRAESNGKAVRLTIADPTAPSPVRLETFTMTTAAQFGAALVAVLDHLA